LHKKILPGEFLAAIPSDTDCAIEGSRSTPGPLLVSSRSQRINRRINRLPGFKHRRTRRRPGSATLPIARSPKLAVSGTTAAALTLNVSVVLFNCVKSNLKYGHPLPSVSWIVM